MPRKARVVIPRLPHHIMHRGNNRRRLFSYSTDYRTLLGFMHDAVQRVEGEVAIHAFVLMANHLHLIVTPRTKPALSEFVKWFAQRYTEYRNPKRAGSGKLWEARFVSKPITTDAYLAICHAYLELNPVRAGLVHAPGDYRWSSWRSWAGRTDFDRQVRGLLTASPWYRSLSPDARLRPERFTRWVEACRIFGAKPSNVSEWDKVEAYSEGYSRRLRRPDESSAMEPRAAYKIGRLRPERE